MKIIPFKEANFNIQTQQGDIPLYKSVQGKYVTCWKLNIIERLILLFTGKLWNVQITNNKAPQPVVFSVQKSQIIKKKPAKKVESKLVVAK